MEELYLNDILIDLPEKSVAITYQINNLGELVNRQSNFSNSIEVPKTDWNVKAMDMLGVSGSTSIKPYRKIKAKYVVDGIELISAGTVEILETSKNYKIRIYDGAVEFMDLIKDKKLSELNFSAYNHSLTIANYIASFTKTSGYIYADGIFYQNSYSNNMNFKMPSLYVHTLFNEIITQAGYTWEGNISTNPDFLKKVIPAMKGYENNLIYGTSTLLETVSLNNGYVGSSATHQFYTVVLATYNLTGSDIYSIYIDATLSTYSGYARIAIIKDGERIDQIYSNEETGGGSYSNKIIDKKILGSGTLTIEIDYEGSYSTLNGGIYVYNNDYTLSGTISKTTLNPININFNSMFTTVNQLEFMKEIMIWFGLTFKQIKNSKHLKFISNRELLVDRTNANNWSDKFTKLNSESYNSGYARQNKFNYKYESGVEPFADGIMLVDNENNDLEKDVITSLFTATSKNFNNEVSNNWEVKKIDNVETRIPKVDAIKMYNLSYSNAPFYIGLEGVSGYNELLAGTLVPVLQLQTMINTIVNNYTEFKVMLDRYKKVSVELNLSLLDVYNLDFFKLKYFDQLGKYFYLNKVVNFINGKVSKCELIEATDISLLSTTDLIPPTDILSIWITLLSDTTLTLNWSESFDANPVTYEVYKNDVLIATQSGRTYNFTGLTASTNYNFKVRSKDVANNYSAYKSINKTTLGIPADLTPPAQPTGLVSSLVTSNGVMLNWNANTEGDLNYYKVYKNEVHDQTVYTNSFNYAGYLNPSTAYQFKVSAVDTSYNESVLSSAVNITTTVLISAFNMDNVGYSFNTESCNFGVYSGSAKYHNGAYSNPSYGDTVYTNAGGTIPFNGGNLWYKISGGSYGLSIKINEVGSVIDIFTCSGGGEEQS